MDVINIFIICCHVLMSLPGTWVRLSQRISSSTSRSGAGGCWMVYGRWDWTAAPGKYRKSQLKLEQSYALVNVLHHTTPILTTYQLNEAISNVWFSWVLMRSQWGHPLPQASPCSSFNTMSNQSPHGVGWCWWYIGVLWLPFLCLVKHQILMISSAQLNT